MKPETSEILHRMDSLLALLQEHVKTHENCCLKDLVKSIGDNDK
jgi:hypothetical protein